MRGLGYNLGMASRAGSVPKKLQARSKTRSTKEATASQQAARKRVLDRCAAEGIVPSQNAIDAILAELAGN